MLVGTGHGWPVQPETQASTPEQSGRVRLSRADDVHKLQLNLAVADEVGVRAIPWLKQILKVFICGLVPRNGHILKVLWAMCTNQCQAIAHIIFKILEWRILILFVVTN